MTPELIENFALGNERNKKMSMSLKLLISFIVLILNVETITFLLLQTDTVITAYQKTLSFIVLASSFIFFLKWNKADRTCFLFFTLLLVKLIIDSLVGFGSVLVYPSILAVVFPFLFVYFIKNLFKRLNLDIIKVLIVFIFIGYFIFMLFYGHEFNFSNDPIMQEGVGPFAGDTRILHSNSILLILLPYLYYLNQLFNTRRSYFSMVGFSISLIIILLHQHRTVWLVTILSSFLLLILKGGGKGLLKKVLVFALIIIGVFAVLTFSIPGLQQLLLERFIDVFDPLNEDTTSGFRYLQILAYLNYFVQKPIFGWTFSGFELSNPFLDDNWEDKSGHHFHNAYIEVLFYYGITGLLLKFYPLYSVVKKIRTPKVLSDTSKILAVFSVSGFLYAFSYVPPLIFWGIVGLCLYYIDRDFRQQPIEVTT